MATAGSNSSGSRSSNHSTSQQGSEESEDESVKGLSICFGQCKWFNAARGYGFITPEADAENEEQTVQDIFVYQKAIKMPGFRCLSEGQRVICHYKESQQGLEAVKVTDTEGKPCKGSDKRPPKRRKRPDKCYNCGEAGHHAKECQFPPLPKRCHHCKAVDHLVADCPRKRDSGPMEPSTSTNTSDKPNQ